MLEFFVARIRADPEAANYLRTRAERIAQDLQAATCDSSLIEAIPRRERTKRG